LTHARLSTTTFKLEIKHQIPFLHSKIACDLLLGLTRMEQITAGPT
jgi:hypothetical protein